jgi:hypothetical protein
MKALSIVTDAILLGLGGTAMAMGGGDHGSGENNQNTSTTGPNPFMPEFSTPSSQGRSALRRNSVHPHVVTHHVKR